MLVRLVFPWDWSNTFRLIPDECRKIGNVEFTSDNIDKADLVVIVNYTPYDLRMNAKEAWIFHHEPSNDKYFSHWKKAYPYADRVYGVWDNIGAKNFTRSIPYLFWHASGSYDYYKNLNVPAKAEVLSCITSNKQAFDGHKKRLDFLYTLQELMKTSCPFNIVGNGIMPVKTKDEVLIPYKYSIVLENSRQNMYFTEKILDAYLCCTMPVYFGAPDIYEYFPKGSAIILDELDPHKAKEIIKNAIENKMWENNLDKIIEARNLVLEKYNFYFNIVSMIEKYSIEQRDYKNIFIPKSRAMKHPLISKIKSFIRTKPFHS